jgi:hypothetical protein
LLYRIDLNDDKKISYDEFQDMFFPFQKHLLFEETNEDEKYDYGIDSYNDILINYSDIYKIDINPYKDNSLTEPKIICNYNEFEDEEENDNFKLQTENKYFINKINNNEIDEQNPFKNDINIDVYKSDDFKIKYDENLINEINGKNNDENEEIYGVNYDDNNLNDNVDNNKNDNKENIKLKKEENNLDIHGSMIFFDDN